MEEKMSGNRTLRMTDLSYILVVVNTRAEDSCKSHQYVGSKAEVPKMSQIEDKWGVSLPNQGGLNLSTWISSLLMIFKTAKPLIKLTLNNTSQSSIQRATKKREIKNQAYFIGKGPFKYLFPLHSCPISSQDKMNLKFRPSIDRNEWQWEEQGPAAHFTQTPLFLLWDGHKKAKPSASGRGLNIAISIR